MSLLATMARSAHRGRRGQGMVENLIAMLVLCLVLVGLLQIFHLSVAQLLVRYSSFCGARSYVVGFADYLTLRSTRVGAIAGSGQLVFPDNQEYGSPVEQYYGERLLIPDYIQGIRWLEYEYWFGETEYEQPYYAAGTAPPSTTLGCGYRLLPNGLVEVETEFFNYPFVFFDMMDRNRVWFDTVGDATNLSGSARMANHAADYLDE